MLNHAQPRFQNAVGFEAFKDACSGLPAKWFDQVARMSNRTTAATRNNLCLSGCCPYPVADFNYVFLHLPSFSIIFHHFSSFSIIFHSFSSFSIIFHHFPSFSFFIMIEHLNFLENTGRAITSITRRLVVWPGSLRHFERRPWNDGIFLVFSIFLQMYWCGYGII